MFNGSCHLLLYVCFVFTLSSKGLKVNLGKTKVIVSGGVTEVSLSKSKVDLHRVYSLRVKANSFLVCNVVSDNMVDVLE